MQFSKPNRIPHSHVRFAVCLCTIGLMIPGPHVLAGDVDNEESATIASGTSEGMVAELELIRRQALLDEANELMRKGREALEQDRSNEALQAFGGVREMLPQAPATDELRAQATAGYVEAAIAEAEKLAARGDIKGGKKLMASVLSDGVAPGDPDALAMMERLNDPIRYNPALTAGHVKDVEKVVELLELADGAIELGQYDRAKGFYEAVLRIDSTNTTARRGMVRVVEHKNDAAVYDHARAELLLEVDKQWEMQVPAPDNFDLSAMSSTEPSANRSLTVREKIKRITVPRIAFDQVTLSDAIDFLRAVSLREDKYEADSAAKGVNFNINLSGISEEAQRSILETRFDLQLRDVPIQQALKYITEITKTSFKVDDFSVIILPPGVALDELIARTYKVPPDFVTSLSTGSTQQEEADPFADTGSQKTGLLAARKSVQELLKSKGLSFPDGAFANFNAATGTLRMVNTPLQHDTVSTIIDSIREREPVAVSVQVTVIKVQQDNLSELGFDWLLNPSQIGSNTSMAGGTIGNSGGRFGEDFSPVIGSLPPLADAAVVSGVMTNGLRSGSQVYSGNSIDEMILNPNRASQAVKVAPGVLSLTGVFTDGAAQVMMRGLDQKKGVSMMANPSVVTTSGQAAKILVAKEFIYPTEYDPPEIGSGDSRTVTPANPTAFETRDVGITLDVLPVADDSKTYIDLTLSPEIVEFNGFVNYGSPIFTVGGGFFFVIDNDGFFDILGSGVEESVKLTENRILMPIFSTQRTTTQLTVADGATIVYGGLLSSSIKTVDDKVPVLGDLPMLGRFFQSTGLKPTNTAVVFMVRVQLMDATGRPFRELSSR